MPSVFASVPVAVEVLGRNPLRTSLSTLGIVMGAASLTAVLALGDGAEQLARRSIEREGWQSVVLAPLTERVVDGLRVPATEYPLFAIDTADALRAEAGGNVDVRIVVEGTGLLGGPGARERAARVLGWLDLHGPAPNLLPLAEGRHLTEAEARGGAPVAVISHRLAEELRKAPETSSPRSPRTAPGEAGADDASHGPYGSVSFAGTTLAVVGILAPHDGERTFTAMVPFANAEQLMVASPTPRPRQILIRAASVEDVDAVRTAVERFAARQPDWTGQYVVSALGVQRLDQLARGILAFKLLMGAFTAISLLVGGVGIMNVLLASILERTREIGIRKAVGARRRDVLWQFLVESLTIATAGTIAGVALGLAGAFAVTALIRQQTETLIYAAMTWQTAAIAAMAAMTVGVLAGLYPALRASRLTPVDAIQRE